MDFSDKKENVQTGDHYSCSQFFCQIRSNYIRYRGILLGEKSDPSFYRKILKD